MDAYINNQSRFDKSDFGFRRHLMIQYWADLLSCLDYYDTDDYNNDNNSNNSNNSNHSNHSNDGTVIEAGIFMTEFFRKVPKERYSFFADLSTVE